MKWKVSRRKEKRQKLARIYIFQFVFYLEPHVFQAVTHSIATFLYNFLLSKFPPSPTLVSLLFPHHFLFLSCFCFIVSFFLFSFFGTTAESGYCRGILHPGHVTRLWTDGWYASTILVTNMHRKISTIVKQVIDVNCLSSQSYHILFSPCVSSTQWDKSHKNI